MNGSAVIAANPAHASQECLVCGIRNEATAKRCCMRYAVKIRLPLKRRPDRALPACQGTKTTAASIEAAATDKHKD